MWTTDIIADEALIQLSQHFTNHKTEGIRFTQKTQKISFLDIASHKGRIEKYEIIEAVFYIYNNDYLCFPILATHGLMNKISTYDPETNDDFEVCV